MALIRARNGTTPQFGSDVFLAETAVVIGDVVMGDQCSVWYNAVIRGDVNAIRIGHRTNIQDLAMLHCTYQRAALTIGNDVSIGHSAIVHGCTIHDKVLIGMGAIVMDHAVIGEGSVEALRARNALRRVWCSTRLPLAEVAAWPEVARRLSSCGLFLAAESPR